MFEVWRRDCWFAKHPEKTATAAPAHDLLADKLRCHWITEGAHQHGYWLVLFLHSSSSFLYRPTTLSPISAKQQTSSSSPWWSGPKGSRTFPNSPSMTRSSYYEQVDPRTHPQTHTCRKWHTCPVTHSCLISLTQQIDLCTTHCPRGGVVFPSGQLVIPRQKVYLKSLHLFNTFMPSSLIEQWNQI